VLVCTKKSVQWNKLNSPSKAVGIDQVRIVWLNSHFSAIFPSKFGARIIRVCVLYSKFYGIWSQSV